MDTSVVRVVVTLLFTGMYMVIDVYMCIYIYVSTKYPPFYVVIELHIVSD